jgi:hypothetical protein
MEAAAEEGSSEKAATFGSSPSPGQAVAEDALSQSMPALKSKRTYDVGSPDNSRQRATDAEGASTSSSSSSSSSSSRKKESAAKKISAGKILSKVKQLRIAEGLKLDEQLHALEEHEREAKEEEMRLELLRQKNERERRAQAQEAERRKKNSLVEQRLTRGHLFYKHGRNRRAERRFVYVTPRLDKIAWRNVTSKTDSKPSKEYQVTDLIRVTAGLNDGKTKPVQSEQFCLTLHLHSRTIQLECDNEVLRDAWLEAFRWLKTEN